MEPTVNKYKEIKCYNDVDKSYEINKYETEEIEDCNNYGTLNSRLSNNEINLYFTNYDYWNDHCYIITDILLATIPIGKVYIRIRNKCLNCENFESNCKDCVNNKPEDLFIIEQEEFRFSEEYKIFCCTLPEPLIFLPNNNIAFCIESEIQILKPITSAALAKVNKKIYNELNSIEKIHSNEYYYNKIDDYVYIFKKIHIDR